MAVASQREKVSTDACQHGNRQQYQRRDQKTQPLSEQMCVTAVTKNHPRADGKEDDREAADKCEMHVRQAIGWKYDGKKKSENEQDRPDPKTLREKRWATRLFEEVTLKGKVKQNYRAADERRTPGPLKRFEHKRNANHKTGQHRDERAFSPKRKSNV